MEIIAPRISYSPDGILELNKDLSGSEADRAEQIVALLSEVKGAEVEVTGDEARVSIDIPELFGSVVAPGFAPEADEQIEAMIQGLHPALYFDFEDPRDPVLSLNFWGVRGASAVIHPQFQRWLNQGGPTEEAARRCAEAMAFPFGPANDEYDFTVQNFQFNEWEGGSEVYVNHGTYRIVIRPEEFGFTDSLTTEEGGYYRHGKGQWSWLDISTMGNCACWGVSGDDRRDIDISGTYKGSRLYEMHPHNVDFARQSLSLMLGAATLVYEAARYEGDEDIAAGIEWREPRGPFPTYEPKDS